MATNGELISSNSNKAQSPENNSKTPGKMAASTETKGDENQNKVMTVVFLSLLLDLLAFTMILPLLPALLDYYGQDQSDPLYGGLQNVVHNFRGLIGIPDTPRWNAVLFGGLIGSLFSYLQFLASPVIGAASDVYGRRPVLLLSMCGVASSYLLWVFSHSFSLFVLARVIGGISKGNVSVSTAVVADIMPREKRGKGMAMIGIAFSVGFLLGPMIGAYFSSVLRGSDSPLYVVPACFALTLALIDIIYVYCYFEETLPEEKRVKAMGDKMDDAWKLINPLSLFNFEAVNIQSNSDFEAMKQIGIVYFLYLFFYSGMEFTLTFLVHINFNYDSMQQGKMFFFIGLIMICVQGGYVRRMKQGSEQKLAIRGLLVLIPGFIIVGLAPTTTVLYVGLILFAFASSTVVPCLTTLISSFGDADQKGTIMGIFRSLGALARATGPVVASTVYWCGGSQVCYCLGAIMLLLPFMLLRRIKLTHIQ